MFHFLRALAELDKPAVAAVRGRAVGIGLTLLLHCDMVVVAEDALLSVPFINLALAPEAASSLLLPAVLGHQRAFEMFALGEPIDGRTAVAWGWPIGPFRLTRSSPWRPNWRAGWRRERPTRSARPSG